MCEFIAETWVRRFYNFTVKDSQPLDQSGHLPIEQLRQANVEAKESQNVFENYARADCICHFEPASAKTTSLCHQGLSPAISF